MPAGDLVVSDYQCELRGYLTGFGTVWRIGTQVEGLGEPEAKANDATLGHAAGAYLGRDYTGVRIITIPYILRGTAAAVGSNYWDLRGIWGASETNLPLYLKLPGLGKFYVNGRPRALTGDLSYLNVGHVRALATFVCGDPLMTRV